VSTGARASSTSRSRPTISYATVDQLRCNGIEFQDTPDTYYDGVSARVPGHRESLEELQRRRILIDGSDQDGILLQIFTRNVIGRSSSRSSSARAMKASRGQFPRPVRVDRARQERRGVI